MIKANSIKINNLTFPLIDQSPFGNRKIVESIFYEDFETLKGWILSGEFDLDTLIQVLLIREIKFLAPIYLD